MASKLFDYDNPFFMFMSRIWDLMILNFLAVLLCLPVITAGASVTALYYITLKMAEDRESHIYRSFLKAFRDNLVPVSYTHLDVYKRQKYSRASQTQAYNLPESAPPGRLT